MGAHSAEEASVKQAAALFLLKTTEEHKLPLSSIAGLVDDIKLLVSTLLDKVATKAKQILSEEDCKDLFSEEGVQNTFCGLSSNYKLVNYCKEHLGLVVSYFQFPYYFVFNDSL